MQIGRRVFDGAAFAFFGLLHLADGVVEAAVVVAAVDEGVGAFVLAVLGDGGVFALDGGEAAVECWPGDLDFRGRLITAGLGERLGLLGERERAIDVGVEGLGFGGDRAVGVLAFGDADLLGGAGVAGGVIGTN